MRRILKYGINNRGYHEFEVRGLIKMKIKKKYTGIIFSLLMGFGMSFFMSFVMTAINVGFPPIFLQLWMKSWGVGFVASLPAALLLPPIIHKLIAKMTTD